MKIKAVIFDMDGTTVDTIEGLAYAMNYVLEKNSLPKRSINEYKVFVGNGLKKMVERALPNNEYSDEEINLFLEEMVDFYEKNWDYELRLYNGIDNLLDELTKKGIIIAINTNKVQHIAEKIASNCLANWTISHVIGDRINFPNKPSPEGVKEILKDLKIEAKDIIFVGDSNVDIETGRNANIMTVAVSWGFREKAELEEADYIIDHPMELIDIIEKI